MALKRSVGMMDGMGLQWSTDGLLARLWKNTKKRTEELDGGLQID